MRDPEGEMYPDDISDNEFGYRRSISVTQLNEFIKSIIDTRPELSGIYVQGEISNFKNHYATGHMYFTLKDENSAVKAVMFKSNASRLRFLPENGMKVTVRGRVSVYTRDGQYQIYCDSIEPLGVGALYAAFEQLKKKLSSEGLFDSAHKKKIPSYPGKIGIVTSATGAAVRDIINVTGRRWPFAGIIVFPALVQGEGAEDSLITGLKYFNDKTDVDVIIIGRGGGSIEDLWAFNGERLARSIFASRIPVISAVGHETDFTIADFVSDLRAPTPSAAAELAVPDSSELIQKLKLLESKCTKAVTSLITSYGMSLKRCSSARVLTDPMAFIEDRVLQLGNLSDRLTGSASLAVENKQKSLSALSGVLNSLSPLAVLSRGYGAVTDREGIIIKSVASIRTGDDIVVKLSDGELGATVNSINGGNNGGNN